MKAKIILILATLTVALIGPALVPTGAAYAACQDTSSKKQVVEALGQTQAGDACNDNGVGRIVNTIVSILSYVVGIAAIIMVVLSGFRYITSGGDSGKVSAAKTTLIYALVGIAIAVLAQLLVRFVITNAVVAGNEGCLPGYHRRASDNNCVKN